MRTLVAGILVTLLSASPVFAESRPHTRAATITKWALIGAGAGFGFGFLQGMRVYDDATFAEQKIWRAAWLSALAGGVIGGTVGGIRSNPARTPNVSARPERSPSKPAWADVRLRLPASPTIASIGIFSSKRNRQRIRTDTRDRIRPETASDWHDIDVRRIPRRVTRSASVE